MKIKITLDNGDIIETTHPKDIHWVYNWVIDLPDCFIKINDAIINKRHIVSITKVED